MSYDTSDDDPDTRSETRPETRPDATAPYGRLDGDSGDDLVDGDPTDGLLGGDSTDGLVDDDPDELDVGAARSALGRRDYLRALGTASAAGILGTVGASTASAQSSLDEAGADQRIRENQTGPLTVEVVDQDGDPVSDASVQIEMQEHDFVFGSACGADPLINQFGEGDPYREHLRDLFNTAVLGNDHKWAFFEDNQQLADAAVDWLEANGLRIRGHTCIYPVDYAIPGDVQTAIDNGNGQLIRDRTMQHIEDIITHYGDRIMEWDVVNEVLHRGLLHSGVYPNQIDLDDLPAGQIQPWTSQLLADWYSKAESVIDENGLDVDVVTNDYNTMTWSYARSRYAEQLTHLQNSGVEVDGIGLQTHIGPTMGSDELWTYANIDGVFEHYAQFDTNIRITEYDMSGDSWSGHQQRADVLERFLETAYGHPNVDEFVIWGMWDETHWQDEAPFFEEDWSEKPALDVWRTLVFDEWWTSEAGSTSSDGTYTVDAFLGEYEVTVSTDAESRTVTTEVTNADGGQRLVVDVTGSGDGDEDTEPTDTTAVNAGGDALDASSGQSYAADAGYTGGTANSTSDSISGTDDDALYQSERYGESFTYEFTVSEGTYDVELHFTEIYHEADGERVFDVAVEGTTVRSGLDVHAEVGHDAALVETVEGVEPSDGTLQIDFEASSDNATISAIAVQSADDGAPCGGTQGASTATVDGRTVCDLESDGSYRDVNADGEVTQTDVVEFFQVQHRDAWKRPELFDFSGNDSVGHGDVVSLFEYATGQL